MSCKKPFANRNNYGVFFKPVVYTANVLHLKGRNLLTGSKM